MPLTILKSSWGKTKPPVGTPIDWSHPLAKSLLYCFPFNMNGGRIVDEVKKSIGVGQLNTSGTIGYAPNRFAHGMGGTKSTLGAAWNLGLEDLLGMPLTSGTFMIAADFVGAANGGSAFGISGSGTNVLNAYLPYTDGTVYWDFGGITGANRISAAGLTFGRDIWTFTAGLRGSTMWQNTALRASQGTAITRTVSASREFCIGNLTTSGGATPIYTNGNGCTDVRWGFFYVWKRELSMSEIAWLNAEPYAFFRPPSQWISGLTLPPTSSIDYHEVARGINRGISRGIR